MFYLQRATLLAHWLQLPASSRLPFWWAQVLRCLPFSLVGVACAAGQPTPPIPATPETQSSGARTLASPSRDGAFPQIASCDFPRHTDAEFGWARLRVYVNANGSPGKVEILEASEPVFGEHGRKCALRRRYKPPTNDAGNPVGAYVPTLNLRFTRCVAGFAAAALDSSELTQIFVGSAYKRRGIGRSLILWAEAMMPSGFTLRTLVQNEVSRTFYRTHGLMEGPTGFNPVNGLETVEYRWLPARTNPSDPT